MTTTSAGTSPGRRRKKKESDAIGYLFMLPNLIIYGIFVFIHTLCTIFYSFTNFDLFNWKFVGLSNYSKIFKDSFFMKAIGNTLLYAAGTIFISMAIGLLLVVCSTPLYPAASCSAPCSTCPTPSRSSQPVWPGCISTTPTPASSTTC